MSNPLRSLFPHGYRPRLVPPTMLGAIAGAVIAVSLLWGGSLPAHAQQVPPHVFIGSAAIDSQPVSDGTVIAAHVDGGGVSKAVIDGGFYKLLVEQPLGESFAGKIVLFTIGDWQAGESQPWEQGGAHELNLHASSSASDQARPVEGDFDCMVRILGRLPSSSQDVSDQEGIRLLQGCPSVRDNIGMLAPSEPSSEIPQISVLERLRSDLSQVEQEISRVKRETPLKIQRELNALDRKITNVERNLWDKLQVELERLDQQKFDIERQLQQELRTSDFRRHAQIEFKYRGILDNLERERFETERSTQSQVDQQIGRLTRNREITERKLWDDKQLEINRLEQRRAELQDALHDEEFAAEQRQRETEGNRRFELERQMDGKRFQQQEELERQRMLSEQRRTEQRRAEERMQMELQFEEQRLLQQERSDRERMDQQRLLNRDRFGRGIQIQASQQAPTADLRDPSPSTRINLRNRGFFTNSPSGEINDFDKLLDPTSLAVAGIILTLLATSLSLVKGS